MGKYTVTTGQNIYDVALHIYGSVEGVVDLLINNASLSFATTLKAGDELIYTDDFIVNQDVVSYNTLHNITPANGEQHVYMKQPTLPLSAAFCLSTERVSAECEIIGTGLLEIDWGDNSDLETVLLKYGVNHLIGHTFDNRVRGVRTVRWYSDVVFGYIDWSSLHATEIRLTKPLPVERLALKDFHSSLEWLRLLEGIFLLNLNDITTDDLTPIVQSKELMSLDLSSEHLKPTIIDRYLQQVVEQYGTRRNCTVRLSVAPTGEYREPVRDVSSGRYAVSCGMEAIWVILHEESWNEGGAWQFIIGERLYTVDNE